MTQESTDHTGSNSAESTAAHQGLIAERKVADYELNLFRNASLADIHFLFNFIDRVVLDRAIDELMKAEHVLVVGAGECHASAIFMGYLGGGEFANWHSATLCNPAWEALLEEVTSAHVVVAIATCPNSDQNPFRDHTVHFAKRARDNGAIVIAITDRKDTVLTTFANHVLYAPTHSQVLRSHLVTAILIETIIGVTILRSDI